MIKVLWFNFSGSYSSLSMFRSLWESGMSLYVGDLVDNEIEKPKSVCNCGDLTACKANFENINHYSLDIKAIQLNKQPVDYSEFRPEFLSVI